MTLTWYDFVVIGVLLFTTFRGLQRGFVWQLAWIAALVLCFGFAETFSVKLAPHIQSFAPQAKPPLDRWIAMLILYLGFSFLSFGVARMLRTWIEKAKFVEYDRHLGGIFGFVKGVLICLMGTFFIITLSESARATVLESKSGYAAATVMDKLQPVLPQELAEILQPYILKLDPSHVHEGELNSGQADPFSNPGDVLFGNSESAEGTGSDLFGNPPAAETGTGGGVLGDVWDRVSGGGSTTNPAPTAGGSLQDFMRSLPASMSREMQQSAVNAYENATPEERNQLLGQIRSSLPSEAGGILDGFNQLRGTWNDLQKPPATGGQPTANRDGLLLKISQLYSNEEGARTDFRQYYNSQLTGLPSSVANAVLSDWFSDVNAGPNDPDPTTNYKTGFDARIYRHLSAAGVPIDRLSQSLQQRMQNVSRQ